MLTGADVKIDC